jgi:Flp pilus assembly protein TadG
MYLRKKNDSQYSGLGRRGAVAAEVALLLPVLALLFVIGIDFARLFYHLATITNCARNAALHAADPAGSPYTTTQAAGLADASNLSPQPTVSNARTGTDAAGNPYVEVTVSYSFQMLTSYPGFASPLTLSRTVRMRVPPVVPNFP